MNILYINHYAGSIYHGMEYRPYYLAREWVKLGHNVTIVACNYSHVRQKNIILPRNKKYQEELIDGIKYIWCYAPEYKVNGVGRFINILTFLWNVTKIHKQLVNQENPDLVIASSTHPFDTQIANKIAKLSKAKFVYEVHDLWPLSPIELGGMSRRHPFIWLTQKFEDYAYQHADKVVSLLPKAAEYMQQHGMKAQNFIYIPNGVDVDITKVIESKNNSVNTTDKLSTIHQQVINTLRLQYKFLIGYAGGMASGNALKCAIDAIIEINADTLANNLSPEVAFIMLGDGVYKSQLEQYVAQNKLSNVVFLDAVAKNQVPDFLAQMDSLFIGFQRLSLYRFGVSPNKVFDYMLAKKPIIYAVTAGNNLIAEADCGISVEAENSHAIAGAFMQLFNTPKSILTRLGSNGYNYVLENHIYAVLAKKFIDHCLI